MNWRIFCAVSIIVLVEMGCTASKFSSAKLEALSKPILGPGDATGTITQPGSGGDSTGVVNQPGAGGGITGLINQLGDTGNSLGNLFQPLGGSHFPGQSGLGDAMGNLHQDGTVTVNYVCVADGDQPESLQNAYANSNSTYEIKVNGQVCSTDSAKIETMLKAKKLDFNQLCPSLIAGANTIELDVNGYENSDSAPTDAIQVFNGYANTFGVLYASPPIASHDFPDGCDTKADPLIVHVAHHDTRLSLTDQLHGIFYDLLGAANEDRPVKVSWFANDDYGFLALPDSTGHVRTIDQLFGDNTLGPDHKTAANGYEALAKYDTNGDQRIDNQDAVFTKLRVWVDSNHNGIAETNELSTLDQAGIAYISLEYTSDFSETDKYGNTINNKAIVGRSDGSLDVIFDLWLKYTQRSAK